jgi:hypothetical protein
MQTKLTLKLDKDKIEKAKIYAKNHHKSLSVLVEQYFSFLTENKREDISNISPLVKELLGTIKPENDEDLGNIRDRYLMEKYLNE